MGQSRTNRDIKYLELTLRKNKQVIRKVLFLSDSLEGGGAERQMMQTLKYLPPTIDRQLWSLEHGDYEQVIRQQNIQVTINTRRFQLDFSPTYHLLSLVNDYKPDLIHSWGWMSTFAAIPICKMKHIPLINGTIRSGTKQLRRALLRQIGITLADGVIANSMAGLHAWKVPPEKSQVIYNGFDPERLKLIELKSDHCKRAFTVGMVGRMSCDKDFAAFISSAVYIVKNTQADIHFVAVGNNGDQREMIIDQARYLLEKKRIEFPSPSLEVLPIVKNFDVGVLMTNAKIAEGLSNAIMEYMACSLPVVASSGGGNAELVSEGKTGYFVPAGNWQALAERILFLYDHPEIRLQLGREGCRRITEDFSIDTMINHLVAFYERFDKNSS